MYNEKTHIPAPFTRAPMRNGGTSGNPREPMRDISPEERLDGVRPPFDEAPPRRLCDGTLRDPAENGSPRGLGGGCLGGSPRRPVDNDSRSCPVGCGLGGALRELGENGTRQGCQRGRLDGSARNSLEQCPISDCARGRCGGWGLEGYPLAMVYSPCQAWRDAYTPEMALSRGTLFAELDLPFEGSKCKRGCM